MPEKESIQTMLQQAMIKLDVDLFAIRTSTTPASGSQTVVIDQTGSNNKVQAGLPTVAKATSTFAAGKQAAPAAGTTIAATAALAAGVWDIEARIAILGTTVANVETNNVVFKVGATTVATPTVNVPGTAGSTAPCVFKARVLSAGGTVSLVSGASAATAGSIYVADIVATPVDV